MTQQDGPVRGFPVMYASEKEEYSKENDQHGAFPPKDTGLWKEMTMHGCTSEQKGEKARMAGCQYCHCNGQHDLQQTLLQTDLP